MKSFDMVKVDMWSRLKTELSHYEHWLLSRMRAIQRGSRHVMTEGSGSGSGGRGNLCERDRTGQDRTGQAMAASHAGNM